MTPTPASAATTYILDTSVLLSDPSAHTRFGSHDVVLPLVVVKELEGKRHHPMLGYNARKVLRSLEGLRLANPDADMRKGVAVNAEGGTLRIEINHVDASHLPESLRAESSNDTRILAVADALRREGSRVVVVSKDLPLRLLAHGALGIPAEDYVGLAAARDGYSGIVECSTSPDVVDALYRDRVVDAPELLEAPLNTGVILTSARSSALATVEAPGLLRLVRGDAEAFGVHARSAEQRIALHHLLDPDRGIVSLGGAAGTGKSVLALAAALEHVMERHTAKRITVFRPVLAVGGQDLGFLPGTEQEKMDPWGAAVEDALRAIAPDIVIDEVKARGLLEVLPLTHIRGRTLTDSVVIVDECQNLDLSVILAAITRIGDGSRIFLLHDVSQRDNLRVGRYDGIAAAVERLADHPLFAHVTLVRSERSAVAALASRLLDEGA